MKIIGLIIILFFITPLLAQETVDTLKIKPKKFTIDGAVDTYYGITNPKIGAKQLPYFVSSNAVNAPNINLVYVAFNYQHSFFRMRVIPGFGTYMKANYSAEPSYLKNIVEGSIGLRLHERKNIWIDAGVLSSPFTNENAISKNQLMYTRSLSAENSPYYLFGVKTTVPLTDKLTSYVYLINGWQQIQDVNNEKALATQIEYKPNDRHLFNFNTYVGNENSRFSPTNGMRYFADIYWTYNHQNFSASSNVYVGNQKKIAVDQHQSNNFWWQANIIGKYQFTPKTSLSGRIEYFNDNKKAVVSPINNVESFRAYSSGLCLNINASKNILFRLEGRHFFSDKAMFVKGNNNLVSNMTWIVSNCTISF